MCIELGAITTFVYLATWVAIIYYLVSPSRSSFVLVLIVVNAVILCIHLHGNCSVGYIKTGAATEAVLLLVLYVSGTTPARNTRSAQTARRDSEKAGGVETRTGS